MANPSPIIRNEEQELKRQISFTKTLRARVYTKAEQKANEYTEKLEALTARLEEIESTK